MDSSYASLDLTNSHNESIVGLGTRRLRAAGGLPNQSTRYEHYNGARRRSTVMGDASTSAPPIVRRASTMTSKSRPSVAGVPGMRESIAQGPAAARTSSTSRRQTLYPNDREEKRQSAYPAREERRKSTYPGRDENRSSQVQYADETMAYMDFPGSESLEDFSQRIMQEQQIRFQSKRQLLKLMLDEADIDADMLLSQDLREKVDRPESEIGEESFREYPPPPPSPHPASRLVHLQKVMSDLTLDAQTPTRLPKNDSKSLIVSEPEGNGTAANEGIASSGSSSSSSSGSGSGSSSSGSSSDSNTSSGEEVAAAMVATRSSIRRAQMPLS